MSKFPQSVKDAMKKAREEYEESQVQHNPPCAWCKAPIPDDSNEGKGFVFLGEAYCDWCYEETLEGTNPNIEDWEEEQPHITTCDICSKDFHDTDGEEIEFRDTTEFACPQCQVAPDPDRLREGPSLLRQCSVCKACCAIGGYTETREFVCEPCEDIFRKNLDRVLDEHVSCLGNKEALAMLDEDILPNGVLNKDMFLKWIETAIENNYFKQHNWTDWIGIEELLQEKRSQIETFYENEIRCEVCDDVVDEDTMKSKTYGAVQVTLCEDCE